MTVSIVMPVYNAGPYLAEAIRSILTQSHGDLELIAVDDGSTDGSYEYLQTIDDPRLRVERIEQSGPGRARNVGIGLSRGAYIGFMDADDVSLPDRIERQVRRLEDDPDLALVGCRAEYYATGGDRGFPPPLALNHEQIRADLIAGRHALVNGTLLFRAEVLRALGGYRIDTVGEDWDLFLRATEAGRAANLPQALYLYRIHAGSTNLKQRTMLRQRYAFACECARRREQGLAERSFDEYLVEETRKPFWRRWAAHFDEIAAAHYRQAVLDTLSRRPVRGYARLALCACLSPSRLVQRLQRQLRPRQGSPTATPLKVTTL